MGEPGNAPALIRLRLGRLVFSPRTMTAALTAASHWLATYALLALEAVDEAGLTEPPA